MNTNNGWQLVPVEPTEEMEAAAVGDYEQSGGTYRKSAYAAMLAAAPAAPGSPASTVADEGAKDERQAFEAWIRRTCPHAPSMLWREEDGYIYAGAEWKAWQARARIEAPAAGDALDAARYRCIRNPPYSGRYGDLYAMTFQGDGDIPLKGEALDAAADRALSASQQGGE